ncbi:Hypothetical protein NTJ_14812 [Nesidiocoris tenuis]|uniref:Uncharacterized protein n=1 Tax=Nesidiocoris tenuis TaxID=355587 RepID=A0ABN7BCL5_9HEMI|nr:Hypothetical protein NTJ_14812 [Nesidiocoris tenuis]
MTSRCSTERPSRSDLGRPPRRSSRLLGHSQPTNTPWHQGALLSVSVVRTLAGVPDAPHAFLAARNLLILLDTKVLY